ncbi:MAG: hypothetical protein RI907_1436 [Pseudomonadota bacterium]|jgi:hypothetical protein
MNRKTWFSVSLAGLMWVSQPACAGRACDRQALKVEDLTRGLALAERTVQRLEAAGVKMAVLARAGQDLSAYSLRYSHLGLAYKDGEVWRVMHKLNHCGTAEASVYREGVGDFFLDSPHQYVAGVVPLRPDVQARLLPLLQEPYLAAGVHTRAYSMVAYPWAQDYQQSNQWAVETLALAMAGHGGSRLVAQRWLQRQGYEPTELHLSTATRLGARLSMANVSFDDHPTFLRFTGRIRTTTVDSVFDWLERSGLGGPQWVVR